MAKEHAESLLSKGVVRIGTLYEFRNEENYGKEIGDNEEGKKSSYMEVNKTSFTYETQPEFTKSLFKMTPNSGTVHLKDLTIENEANSSDLYLYCTTNVYDQNAMKNFGYDACIEIIRPDRFFKCLSKQLKNKGTYQGSHRCIYKPRRLPHYYKDKIHPALIKDPEYFYQKEVRSIWQPKNNKIKPIFLEVNNLHKHCKIKACL